MKERSPKNDVDPNLGPNNHGIEITVIDEEEGGPEPTFQPLRESLRKQLEARQHRANPPKDGLGSADK